jgi:hypothetical protein
MSKPIFTLILVVTGLIALIAAGPTITKLVGALIPLVLVVGIVGAVLRCVWFYTR